MKAGYTDITFILDKSGSMERVRDDTIGGFNGFIKDQQVLNANITFNMVQFNSRYFRLFQNVAIKDVEPLTAETYRPNGNTALYEAICRAIDDAGAQYASMDESERPEKVLFVILTDGEENSSGDGYTFNAVSERIKHQREKYNWSFVFLGSELKTVEVAKDLGIEGQSILHFSNNTNGNKRAYKSLSRVVAEYASNNDLLSCNFSVDDQKAQDEVRISN